MKFVSPCLLMAAGVLLAIAQNTPAQSSRDRDRVGNPQASNAAAHLNASETRFVQETLESGRHEVEMARTALTIASDPKVKEFAQRLVNDHSSANMKLEQIAAENTVPPTTTSTAPPLDDHLSALRGQEFDRAFARDMAQRHQEAIAKFEAQQKTAANGALRDFITTTLPTLREHLKQAQDLSK